MPSPLDEVKRVGDGSESVGVLIPAISGDLFALNQETFKVGV